MVDEAQITPPDGNVALPSVLVINDRESQRIAIDVMLAPLALDIVAADSGHAGLRAVLRQTFALILMDVRMPIMDGFETAALIRQRRQSDRTPIMFVTAYREDEQMLAAYTSGAVDFVLTPIVPEVLRAKVSIWVDRFLQTEELHRKSDELQRSLASITSLNQALSDSHASTQAVLDNVADGILTTDQSGVIESINRSAQTLFGYREDQVIGQPVASLIDPHVELEAGDPVASSPTLLTSLAQAGTTETLGRRQDGSKFALEIEHGQLNVGDRSLTLTFVRDISERKAHTEALAHQALHDGLTGLANRTLFAEHVCQALASAARNHESQAILVMDLDGFKRVNDSLGHDHGDHLLKQFSDRLVAATRETDTVARLGGDEFAVLPGEVTDLPAAAAMVWRLQQTCASGFALDEQFVHVSVSIGIAMFPQHGKTPAELLRRADVAMYHAKRSGTGHAIVDDAQEEQATRQLKLLLDLRECVSRGELILHYQPKIELSTGVICGVEALVRWQHPARGVLLPGVFIAEAERSELLGPLNQWVLNEALHQQRTWDEVGIDLTMAVNISGHSLTARSTLLDTLEAVQRTWDTKPDRLILELTESALIESEAPPILARIHDLGIKLSIDDFVTGYSSLSYLQRLPVDEIKIDKSFVTSLANGGADDDDSVIVRSTIELAHNLGLTVVAEGVEDDVALDMLCKYQCDRAQGYFLGRPCPAEELTPRLTASPALVGQATALTELVAPH
jgi:diguanylate cyclase (GGDEF)-like protein/PAS domain S-box-containing protein